MGTHVSDRESFVRTGVLHAAARDAIENAIRMLPGDLAQRQEIVASIVDGGYYALRYTGGTTMEPELSAGDTLIVEPLMALADDHLVVLYRDVGEDEDGQSLCARLRRFDDADWHLSQHTPPREFTLSRAEWPACHRVTAVYFQFPYAEGTANG